MQMQIYNKKTKEVVAWLETRTGNIVLHNDYGVKTGSNLRVKEVNHVHSRCEKGNGKREKVCVTG